MIVRLVCLITGKTKDGRDWGKITIKRKKSDGGIVLKDFYIDRNVVQKMIADRLIEDVDADIRIDLDEYLRPTIVDVRRVASLKTE